MISIEKKDLKYITAILDKVSEYDQLYDYVAIVRDYTDYNNAVAVTLFTLIRMYFHLERYELVKFIASHSIDASFLELLKSGERTFFYILVTIQAHPLQHLSSTGTSLGT